MEKTFEKIQSKISPSDSFKKELKQKLVQAYQENEQESKPSIFLSLFSIFHMKKSFKVALITVLILLIGGGGTFVFRYSSINLGTDVTMASYIKDTMLEVTNGTEVFVKKGDSAQYEKITGKIKVEEAGWYIKVGEQSEAIIYWMDDSVTRLKAGTEIHITQLEVDTNDPTNTGIQFDIFNGEVWSKAMNIVNDKATFSMKSGNVIAGLRGTTLTFSANGNKKKVRTINHAIYLVGFGVNLAEGEEANISEMEGNGNVNMGNGNINGIVQGNLLVQVDKIPSDFYQSEWYTKNIQQDEQHDKDVKQALLDQLSGQIAGVEDPLRQLKMDQTIQGTGDLKEKAKLLLQSANEKLQLAVIALSKGETEKGERLWDEYKQRINQLKDVLAQITDDPSFVLDMQRRIVANGNLWVKYSYLLLPDNVDITDAMEELVLGLTTDEETRKKLQDLFDARDFFSMTDQLDQGASPEEIKMMLAQYKELLQKMQEGKIEDYECKILLSLRDKLKVYVLDLPPVFECQAGSSGGGGSGQCSQDTPVRCPDGACKKTQEECGVVCPEKKILCPDKQTCVEVLTDCPVICPEGKVVCPDKSCADKIESCPAQGCTTDKPIRCPTGQCVVKQADCSGLCPTGQVKCPNGKCVQNSKECTSTNTNVNRPPVNANQNKTEPVKPACGNQICEKDLGETTASCEVDCPAPKPVCGNQICEKDLGETVTSCPTDCEVKPVCGNKVCENGETSASCPIDCGPPPVITGEVQ